MAAFTHLNESSLDRALRIVFGIILLFFGWGIVVGMLGLIFKLIGIVLLVTGAIGWCPAYALLGISTRHPTPPAAPAGSAH